MTLWWNVCPATVRRSKSKRLSAVRILLRTSQICYGKPKFFIINGFFTSETQLLSPSILLLLQTKCSFWDFLTGWLNFKSRIIYLLSRLISVKFMQNSTQLCLLLYYYLHNTSAWFVSTELERETCLISIFCFACLSKIVLWSWRKFQAVRDPSPLLLLNDNSMTKIPNRFNGQRTSQNI